MQKNAEPKRPTFWSTLGELLANPATSDWLKNAITSARKRDVVDALNDAEILVEVLTVDYDNITRRTNALAAARADYYLGKKR